jgi:hypothetical protein
VIRWRLALPLLAVLGCSSLDEGEGGVVGLEIQFPDVTERTLEVGEQIQMSARALDADGETVEAPIEWRVTNAGMTVDGNGLVTAVAAGTTEVQAVVGSLASERVPFSVLARADTVIIVGDSVLVVSAAADPPIATPLPVRLESFSPAGPVAGQGVFYEITQPVAGTAPVVQLAGSVQGDTLNTGADGTATATISLVAGQVPPDTAIVTVGAERLRGASVPGSGQRFIILFQ